MPYFFITELAFIVLGFSQLVFVINVWKAIFPNPFSYIASNDGSSSKEVAA